MHDTHDKTRAMSRRVFAQRLTDLFLFGGLSHFAIASVTQKIATTSDEVLCTPRVGSTPETDECPGGGPSYDICKPAQGYADKCPGEKMPEDECPPDGNRKEDRCDTGFPSADICVPGVTSSAGTSDQCQSGKSEDDLCDVSVDEKDICYSGISPEPDACPPDGSEDEGDYCPGGGGTVDNCAGGKGDGCADEGDFNENPDNCMEYRPEREDECVLSADICYKGTDSTTGVGGYDACQAVLFVAGAGSDQCITGTEDQDKCAVEYGPAEIDYCIPTQEGESGDLCAPKTSDDICFEGLTNSDECKPSQGDEDECPGGRPDADECLLGLPPEDECPGGHANADSCLLSMPAGDEPCLQDRCEEEDLCRENDSCGTEDVCEASDACLQGDTVE